MKRVIFIGLFIFILLLVIIRVVGDGQLVAKSEQTPLIKVNTESLLYKKVQAVLDDAQSSNNSLFYPVRDPHLALISRIKLAERSVDTIDVQYYLFHDDDAGRALLATLIEAAERGVKVRVLLDDMDISGREGLFSRLVAEQDNFQVRIFNPVWFRSLRTLEFLARFPRVTRRMHNKSFTVDNVVSVVGGRNIGNEYFNIHTEVAFADFDVIAGGKIAKDVTQEFDQYWHSGIGVNVSRLGNQPNDKDYEAWKNELASALEAQSLLVKEGSSEVTAKLFSGAVKPYFDKGSVIYDRPNKVLTKFSDTSDHLAPKILDMMKNAKDKLLITSPYFIPRKAGMYLFRDLRERGVEVIILTNSFSANDVAAVHSGYMDYREELLELGVELFELKAFNDEQSLSFFGSKNASLHAKSFIVDQKRIFVGSFNLDPRSAIHNTEMGVVFDSHEYALTVYEKLEPYLSKHAYKVILNKNKKIEWRETNSDGQQVVHHHEPETEWWMRLSVYLVSFLPVEWLL